ncbi:MAG: cytochrome c1 [Alphaproteobacteria bacterium]|nr:cytochrome c1 [Alphaproteobacteria bacterium]MBF0251508.1 cytochrome c1 [Alphaproteobacteria bacterium]
MRKLFIIALMGLSLGFAGAAHAAGGAPVPAKQNWTFTGLFGGGFDKAQLKRGGQVFFEVCNGCHSVSLMAYRNLVESGAWTEDEAKELASGFEVQDGPNDEGEMFMRPARLSDRFVSPYPNDKAAAAAHGAIPPDLSVITKARKYGPDYIHALLIGYKDEVPEGVTIPEGSNYNEFFPGNAIAMAAPLTDGAVEYADGTEATLDQLSRDVVTFLAWAAEPELEARTALGIKVLIYLVILTAMLGALKHRIWRRLSDPNLSCEDPH